jgi:thiamine biosynthesis lipoprotein
MKKINKLILILSLIFLITGCVEKEKAPIEPLSRTEFMMDTVMTIKTYDKNDDKILDKVFERLEEIENIMSATIETSEISKINLNAGIAPVEVSPDTYYVIKEAKKYAEVSLGAYEPTIGPLVDLWAIKSGEIERDWIPSELDIETKKDLIDYNNLELLDGNRIFLKEKGMKIDLGSIVKGYAADEAKKVLSENGVNIAIIDLGGNVFAHGVKDNDLPWTIGIQNPLEATGGYLGVIEVKNKSIVTSGDYERYFEYEGKKYHHIIDSKTGYPSDNEIMGVTIISDKSIDGDAWSTTLFVLGVDRGMELINTIEGVDAIFILKDKSIYVTDFLKDKFTLKDNNLGFTIK